MKIDHMALSSYDLQCYQKEVETNQNIISRDVYAIKTAFDVNENYIYSLQSQISNLIYRVDLLTNELDRIKGPASMMLGLIKVINETPALYTEWERFMTLIKLSADPEDLK